MCILCGFHFAIQYRHHSHSRSAVEISHVVILLIRRAHSFRYRKLRRAWRRLGENWREKKFIFISFPSAAVAHSLLAVVAVRMTIIDILMPPKSILVNLINFTCFRHDITLRTAVCSPLQLTRTQLQVGRRFRDCSAAIFSFPRKRGQNLIHF